MRNNSKSLRGESFYSDDDDEDGIIWDYMILDEVDIVAMPFVIQNF